MSENFPNMEKHIQVQETPRTPNKLNLRGTLKHHNLCKKKVKKTAKPSRKRKLHKKKPHKIIKEFLIRGKARGEWDDIIFKGINSQPKSTILSTAALQHEGGIKIFLNKHMW